MEEVWISLAAVPVCEESGNEVVKCLWVSAMKRFPNPMGATENAQDVRGNMNKNKLEDRNDRAMAICCAYS